MRIDTPSAFCPGRPESEAFWPIGQGCDAHSSTSGRSRGAGRLEPALSRAITLYRPRNPSVCADPCSGVGSWMALSRCGQPCTTHQLGLPRRGCSLGVGVRFPVAGRRRITAPRAPAVVEHLVSSLRILVSVSSLRPPARLPSCPVPSHAPSPPAHIRPLLSSTRRPLPLAFGRRRGLNTVGFGVAIKVRPRA